MSRTRHTGQNMRRPRAPLQAQGRRTEFGVATLAKPPSHPLLLRGVG
ncbi:MAG TPA: hypothetical protein H9881_08960 [Candidatus Stackebrandtia excrementipullorum]|nr:hypothetical protein [Candidatus Stackebrandtia excrementipullorum]